MNIAAAWHAKFCALMLTVHTSLRLAATDAGGGLPSGLSLKKHLLRACFLSMLCSTWSKSCA